MSSKKRNTQIKINKYRVFGKTRLGAPASAAQRNQSGISGHSPCMILNIIVLLNGSYIIEFPLLSKGLRSPLVCQLIHSCCDDAVFLTKMMGVQWV